jgi:hypothetical protein
MLRSLIRRAKLFFIVVGAPTAMVAGALPASAHDGDPDGSARTAVRARPAKGTSSAPT